MADSTLSLAVNGREHQLEGKLVRQTLPLNGLNGVATWSVAIVGLGYVGLPTAAALHGQCGRIIGIDVNRERLRQIEAREPIWPARTGCASMPRWMTGRSR